MNFYLDLLDNRLRYLKDKFESAGLEVFEFSSNVKKVKSGDVVVLSPSYKINVVEAKLLPEKIKLFLFNETTEVAEVLKSKKVEQINFMKNEEFVLENARLTAECIICEILCKTELSLYSMDILILGGGRVAKALGEIFTKLNLNYNFTTIERNELKENEIFYTKYIAWDNFKDNLKNYNIVINTIPTKLFTSMDLCKFHKGGYIFEIASKHCLEDGNYIDFNYVLCPALPSKYLPKSAGTLIEKFIKKHIQYL